MIAKKQKKNMQYTKSRAQDVSDLCSYITNARSHTANRPTSSAEPEKVLCSGSFGFSFQNPSAQLSEMASLASQAKSGNPIDHWVLSWQSHESPTPAQLHEAARMFIHEIGLDGHQVIYGAHQNTNNTHLHLAINRVSPTTGRVVKVNKGFDHLAAAKAICVIEHVQGWAQEPNHIYEMTPSGPQERTDRKRSLSDAARAAERTTATESLERRARALAPTISAAQSWQDLHTRLAAHGATYEKRKGGAVLKFGRSGFIKASKASRAASLAALEKRFGQPFERPVKLAPRPYDPAPPRLRRDLDPISLILALIFHLLGMHRTARTILHTQLELERASLRAAKFSSAQARWAAQSVLREEHTAARKTLKSAQDAELTTIKAMSPEQAKVFCEKNNLFPTNITPTPEKPAQAGQGEGTLLQKKETLMAENIRDFEVVHAALGAQRYRLTAKEDNPVNGEGRHFAYGKREAGPEGLTVTGAFRGWSAEEVRKHMPEVVKTATGGRYGTYVTPLSGDTHYILIDDINSAEKLEKAGKYSAALVCESSPGNRQAVLKIRADGDSEIAKKAANACAARINAECGDPAVRNGEQAFRLAGFANNKPKHMEDGQAPLVKILSADGGYCQAAQSIYNEEIQKLREVQRPVQEPRQEAPVAVRGAIPTGENAPSGIEWTDVYGVHAFRIVERVPGLTGRNLDYAVSCRLRAMGYSDGEAVRVVSHSREWNDSIRYGDTPPQERNMEIARAQGVVNSAFYTQAGDRDAGRLGENAIKSAKRAEREYAKSINEEQVQEQVVEQVQEQKTEQTDKPAQRRKRGRSR